MAHPAMRSRLGWGRDEVRQLARDRRARRTTFAPTLNPLRTCKRDLGAQVGLLWRVMLFPQLASVVGMAYWC